MENKEIISLKIQIADLQEKLAKLNKRHEVLFERDYNLATAIERALMEYKRSNAISGSIIK